MIEFSCSCGKKYRLPDRNAGREVRCNQCTKTLIVPNQTQAEPVIPLSDSIELIIEPEKTAVEQPIPAPEHELELRVEPNEKELKSVEPKPAPIEEKRVEKTEEIELILEPEEKPQPVVEPKPIVKSGPVAVSPFKIDRKGTAAPKPKEPEKEPEHPKTPVSGTKTIESKPTSAPVAKASTDESSPTDTAKAGFGAGVPLPTADPDSPRFLSGAQSSARFSSCLILALLVFALGVVGVSGGVFGWFASNTFSHGGGTGGLEQIVDGLDEQLVVAETTAEERKTKFAESLTKYADDVAEAVKQTDDAKRLEAMKQAESLQKSIRREHAAGIHEATKTKFLNDLAQEFQRLSEPTSEEHSPIKINFSAFDKPESAPKSFADWKVSENAPFIFGAQTADGAPILLSVDGDPTAAKTGKKGTLDDLAVALDDSNALKGSETHSMSLRIDSASLDELAVAWPNERNAGISGTEIKELKFCVYLSGDANKVHKPTKPKGLDKTLEFADFRVRVGNGFGYVDYVLAEKDRITLCEKGRIGWLAFSIPVGGNDTWKRTENSRSNAQTVDYIEFRAKPTGQGVSFWVDNLNVVK